VKPLDPSIGSSTPADSSAVEERAAQVAGIFRQHNRTLIGFLVSRLHNEQEAMEIAQEAYVKVLQLEARHGAVSYLRSYLFRTAENLAVDRMRQRRKELRDLCVVSFAEELSHCDCKRQLRTGRLDHTMDEGELVSRELPDRMRKTAGSRIGEPWDACGNCAVQIDIRAYKINEKRNSKMFRHAMKLILPLTAACFVSVASAAVYSNAVPATIISVETYTQYGGGDVIFKMASNTLDTACPSGFWIKGNDPGAKSVLAQVLAARATETPVVVYADTAVTWTGAQSAACLVWAVRG
jgi:DNA-directed RNA polymerase specialized sigma24 family protein